MSKASRTQWNAIRTSVCQLTENVSQVWCCSGRRSGLAPATRMTVVGFVAVEQAAGDGGVTGIGDLGLDAAAAGCLVGQRRCGTCDGDNRGRQLRRRRW